ncbi:NusA-like transcription termination signal-binding factor [Candidatus Woesearchaeota archaeon]|nr:NusA-like transcription termination signal-binding factor [Candidatus Woesearchaeota archaeon]
MSFFEKVTKSKLKDFFEMDDLLIFVVQPAQLWKAVGKKGANVKRLREKFKKNIKIVEYNSDLKTFIQNMIYPLKAKSIAEDDGIIIIETDDRKTKALLIGRNAQALRGLEKAVKRYFKLDEIKIA